MKKKLKATKLVEETRRETMKRGAKHGSLKGGIDKILDRFADPAADSATEVLKKLHSGGEVARPAVDAVVKSAFLFGMAEIFATAKHLGTKVPGLNKIDEEKYESAAGYLRAYAGERVGTKSADAAFEIAPMLMQAFSNPMLKDLLDVADDTQEAEATEEASVKQEFEIPALSED